MSTHNICRGDSNEYPQHTFLWRTEKNYPFNYRQILDEAILMSTHNICFYGELKKIILLMIVQYSLCYTDYFPHDSGSCLAVWLCLVFKSLSSNFQSCYDYICVHGREVSGHVCLAEVS